MYKAQWLVNIVGVLVVTTIILTCLSFATYSTQGKYDFIVTGENDMSISAKDIVTQVNEPVVEERVFASGFQPESFTHDNTECKIQVYRDMDILHKDRNTSSAPCTNELFQEYYRDRNHFYSDGLWFAPDTETPAGSKFLPQSCVFDDSAIAEGTFSKCLTARHVERVLVLGDSNGHFLYERLMEFFRNRSERCDLVRREGYDNKMDPYFEVPGSQIIQKFKGCNACHSRINTCTSADGIHGSSIGSTLSIEYIGSLHIIDWRLLKQNRRESVLVNKTLDEETFIEFLFQKYLPYHGFPDLWLFSTPIHHESAIHTLEEMRQEIVDFKSLVHRYLPRSTTMVIFPNIRSCMHTNVEKAQLFYKTFNKSKNEVMHQMNHLLFDVLREDLLSPNTNILGFLDQGVLACPFTCLWHRDDAHMQDEWYDIMVQSMFSMLCAGR